MNPVRSRGRTQPIFAVESELTNSSYAVGGTLLSVSCF